VVDKAGTLAEQFPQSDYVPEAKFQQGNAQLNLSQLEPAEKTLLSVSEMSSRASVAQQEWFPHVWPLLAEAQVRQKKYSDVLKTADRMRQWQPESALLYLVDEVVGRAFKNQARFEEARQAFQRVTSSKAGEKTETAAKAQLMLAETYFLQQQYKEARDAYLRVHFLYQFPEWQAAALFQSGKCAELLKQPQEAAKDYQLLIEQFKDSEYARQAADRLKSL
jgi:TolA-binding protein